jgi:hypothetical protein
MTSLETYHFMAGYQKTQHFDIHKSNKNTIVWITTIDAYAECQN